MFFWDLFFSSGWLDLLVWLTLHSEYCFEGPSEKFVQDVASAFPLGVVALSDFLPSVFVGAAML